MQYNQFVVYLHAKRTLTFNFTITMKKVLIVIAALLAVTISASAQQKVSFSKDAKLSFGSKVFFVEPISYLGYGGHILRNPQTPGLKGGYCDEFFVNIMELGIRPTKNIMFALGVDYDLDHYRLDKEHIWGADSNNGTVWSNSLIMGGVNKVKYSRLNVHTFAIPVSFEVRANKGAFRIGAIGEYNLPAVVKNKGVSSDGTIKNRITGITTNEFTYSFFAALSYGGLGIYGKYSPAFQFAEGIGPHVNTITIGAVLGLGM